MELSEKMQKAYSALCECSVLKPEDVIVSLLESIWTILKAHSIPVQDHDTHYTIYLHMLFETKHWNLPANIMDVQKGVIGRGEPSTLTCSYCELSVPPSGGYPCKYCDQDFLVQSDRTFHEVIEHSKSRAAQYTCEFCSSTVSGGVAELRKHVKSKHVCMNSHSKCPFGCKTLILNIDPTCLAQHVLLNHFCQVCQEPIQLAPEQHRKMFHCARETPTKRRKRSRSRERHHHRHPSRSESHRSQNSSHQGHVESYDPYSSKPFLDEPIQRSNYPYLKSNASNEKAYSSAKGPFRCTLCPEGGLFSTLEKLKTHYLEIHGSNYIT